MSWIQKVIGLGSKAKARCVNCHFLKKTYVGERSNPLTFGVSEEDRRKIEKDDFTWLQSSCSLGCAADVWDEGYDLDPKERHSFLVEHDREGFCFFFENHPGMFMPAAKVLQERAASRLETATDRRLTWIGLWIAAIGLLANVVFEVYKHYQEPSNKPKYISTTTKGRLTG